MKIVICGYGRMGHEVEKAALSRGHTVIARIDPIQGAGDESNIGDVNLKESDGVIEFSWPSAVMDNARAYVQSGVPAVVGTNWIRVSNRFGCCVSNSIPLHSVRPSRWSVGAHLFFALVEKAAAIINPFAEYDIMVQEYHHRQKADSPSGTALTIGEKILTNNTRKTSIISECLHRCIESNELHIGSVRGGSIRGTHSVTVDSQADTITLTHAARDRTGFATGAVMALEWLRQRSGLFTVDRHRLAGANEYGVPVL